MIGNIDLRISATNPNISIGTVRCVKGSYNNLIFVGVPAAIGKWSITDVYVEIHHPDSSVEMTGCKQIGDVWSVTIKATNAIGTTEKGIIVFADGLDEYGREVKGYVLGLGDYVVVDSDGRTLPQKELTLINVVPAKPDKPNTGDALWLDDGSLTIYDGSDWRHFASRDYVDSQIGNVLEEGF